MANVASVTAVVYRSTSIGLACTAVVMVVLAMIAPAASAQSDADAATVEFLFSAASGQSVTADAAVVDVATGERFTRQAGGPIVVMAPRNVETELRIEPGGRNVVRAIMCEGAERSKAILSRAGARVLVTPGDSNVSCAVEVTEDDAAAGLPLTGATSRRIVSFGLGLVCVGAAALGAAQRPKQPAI